MISAFAEKPELVDRDDDQHGEHRMGREPRADAVIDYKQQAFEKI